VDLVQLAAQASYVGSQEHKSYPSFAGPPKLRSDASRCDPKFKEADALTQWIQEAIRTGQVGTPWEGDFPRYTWIVREGIYYEGRLVNPGLGQYKGYPLNEEERPEGM
jgi:hypothetical protein